ncbi:hypothetical protein JTE90_025590 [Oedothorax gibbosus]|nr:hypothetical protein JTE90_025590 [Oedothorax gibbosus]
MCCSFFGYVLLTTQLMSYPLFYVSLIFYVLNSFGSLAVCLWIAGGVSVEAENFRTAFRRKVNLRKIMFAEVVNEQNSNDYLMTEQDYILSGCDLLQYKRSLIITVVGTILTYTLLLLNLKE